MISESDPNALLEMSLFHSSGGVYHLHESEEDCCTDLGRDEKDKRAKVLNDLVHKA